MKSWRRSFSRRSKTATASCPSATPSAPRSSACGRRCRASWITSTVKPCCQLCWSAVIVDADGRAAWCCNACALKLHAVVEAARVVFDELDCRGECSISKKYDLEMALAALDAAKEAGR